MTRNSLQHARFHRAGNLRSAFSLIELLIVMTAGAGLMMLAVGVIHQTFNLSKLNGERGRQQQALGRLIERLRHDIHWAQSAELTAQPPIITDQPPEYQLRLAFEDHTVTYRFVGHQVQRSQSSPQSEATTGHDRWDLGGEHYVDGSLVNSGQLVELHVWRRTSEQPRLEAHVLATVARHRRLSLRESRVPYCRLSLRESRVPYCRLSLRESCVLVCRLSLRESCVPYCRLSLRESRVLVCRLSLRESCVPFAERKATKVIPDAVSVVTESPLWS